MKQFLAVMALLGLAAVAGAQTPAVTTLKVKARIVVIDVVVTDKQGKPVKNLRASDFALAENGTPQKVDHFEAHTSLSAEDAAKLPPMPKLEPNIFTNYSPAPANAALNVLLFDAMNTTMDNQSVVLQQMQKYLTTPHPGVRMELFELNSDLHLLQGFTSDPELLRAALASRKSAPQTSMLLYHPMSNDLGIDRVIPSLTGDLKPASEDPMRGPDELGQIHVLDRQRSTLEAMAALARYMGSQPGRKNLLWFSASFPMSVVDKGASDLLHETMALFAKYQVAVYPIDARGQRVTCGSQKAPCTTDPMDMMAEDTGGKVFTGTNDLAAAVEQAVDHGSNYYTLTYSPANHDWKGEYRKVEVKLAQAGYTLAYRRGYYAEDLDNERTDKTMPKLQAVADTAPATDAVPDRAKMALHAAMEYGSPQPAEIVFKAAVNPATGHPESVVAKANSLSTKISGPFERYVISIAALPTAFTFTRSAAGKIHMGAQLATFVYSADGAPINFATFKVEGDVDDAHYKSIMANGMKFQQEISVPVKGESFLRIGVEDLATSRVGVVEIPVATVAKLKPLASAPPL